MVLKSDLVVGQRRMNTDSVERLIDVAKELDTPSAASVRTFASRALTQLQTERLRVGIISDEGQPIGDLLEVVDRLPAARDVWSVRSNDQPVGADAWIMVVSADRFDFSQEQRCLKGLQASELAVFVAGLCSDRERVVQALGVDAAHIFWGAPEFFRLEALLLDWKRRHLKLRSEMLLAWSTPIARSLRQDQKSIEDEMARIPELASAERRLQAFRRQAKEGQEALKEAAEELIRDLVGEFQGQWLQWVATEKFTGDPIDRDRIERSLSRWLVDGYLSRFPERLRERLRSNLEVLRPLGQALTGLEAALGTDFTPPLLDFSERSQSSSVLRWLFPLVGGGVGYLRGGWKSALIGAGLGAVLGRWARQPENPLSSEALRQSVADHVTTYLLATVERVQEGLAAECDLESERLKQEVQVAEAGGAQRDRLVRSLERLAQAQALLEASNQLVTGPSPEGPPGTHQRK